MHRAGQLAVHFAASIFAVKLLADMTIQASQILAHTPARTRGGGSNGAEVVVKICIDWRMIEWAVTIRAVAGEVKFVTQLLMSNALGEAVADFRSHRRHVHVQTFSFGIERDVARRHTVRVR